jgi:hypothetical protein
MTELKNEFSWSKTRDEVFKTCLRQYWFSYYGYWNGWLENALERTRQIYILKNLKNRQMWAGEKVHECIQRSLYNIRRGIKVLPVDEIVSITLDQMRAEFRSSKLKTYLKKPKTCALFEHEYEIELTDEQWKEVANNVETCLRNFYASDIYYGLKSYPKSDWLEVEEFSSFHLDDIKINLAIDCPSRRETIPPTGLNHTIFGFHLNQFGTQFSQNSWSQSSSDRRPEDHCPNLLCSGSPPEF